MRRIITVITDLYPEDHPILALFPMRIDGLDILIKIVKTEPPLPGVTGAGKLLDGRRRREACRTAGVTFPTVEYTGDRPESYIIATHAQQSCLNVSQRAMVGTKLATLPKGRPGENPPNGGFSLTQEQAAQAVGASVRNIQRAKRITDINPMLADRVWRGETTLSAAEKELAGKITATTEEDEEEPTYLDGLLYNWQHATEDDKHAFVYERKDELQDAIKRLVAKNEADTLRFQDYAKAALTRLKKAG
jgi:hypothetical protein